MTGFLLRAVIAAFGLWLATYLIDGFRIDDSTTLLIAAVLLGVVNAIVRPIAIVLTFPITIVTLGLFLLVINAGMVALVAWMLPGFHILGFWAALLGALVVGLTGWIGSWFIGSKGVEQIKGR
ncbi:MAG: phage holin family protein [Sinobacteraceae bacterium]|nr:phage holin family protein [Nevskiaceae bacterium]MCP5338620.1 phage holin family protein [Nevskiaceae bacterium]MCP5466701.1 phage holin family protein [Nevskiaceae bacterium]MCP5470501.1 phage holin family protein [Nevskiaceae bacterium]